MEQSKRAAAERAFKIVWDLLGERSTTKKAIIGIGSGSTVIHFIDVMKENREVTKNWTCIPASSMTEQALIRAGICVGVLGSGDIDIAVDGADSVMPKNKLLIKGGGCALLREKVLIEAAKRVFIMIDESKVNKQVPVPVEVLPMAALALESRSGGCIRVDSVSARPVITDNGNMIIDVDSMEAHSLSKSVAGVLETGIFEWTDKMTVLVGTNDGQVMSLQCSTI